MITKVTLVTREELRDDEYYNRLRELVIAMALSRRKLRDLIELTIYEFAIHGQFYLVTGEQVQLPDFVDIFDEDARFISNLTESNPDGTRKRKCRPTPSIVWLDCFFRLRALSAERFGGDDDTSNH